MTRPPEEGAIPSSSLNEPFERRAPVDWNPRFHRLLPASMSFG